MSPTREQGWARQGPSGQDRQDRRDVWGLYARRTTGPLCSGVKGQLSHVKCIPREKRS